MIFPYAMRLTPDTKLHSREHLLADDLSRALGEPKRFSAYLGIALRHHESDLRALLRHVLEMDDLPSEARGKYFFAALRGLPKRQKMVAARARNARTSYIKSNGTKKTRRKTSSHRPAAA